MSKSDRLETTTPVRLCPVHIPKPWGQEIWYTGMEVRGESQVRLAQGEIGLSAYLAADPDGTCANEPVLLLKVLDPKPVEVLGDLYFEVHEHKREVYVVTHVDPGAWPAGTGAIRFGMDPARRAQFSDDQAFRDAFLKAVQAYEQIRRAIDEQGATGIEAQELAARRTMEGFTRLAPLRQGDVVRVPTWTPHSLQHGVRVVEFQSPTYERYIISFAQKVLTQNHWDTAHAVAHMSLDPPAAPEFEQVRPGVERVARFDEFNVWRVNGAEAGPLHLPRGLPYAVCMALSNVVTAGPLRLSAEQACFIPRGAVEQAQLAGQGQALIAAPGL